MQVQDFPRPRNNNRRGVHWSTILYPAGAGVLSLWIAELQQLHVKWVKILDDGGGSSLPLCEQLLAADIFPIVRLYRQAPNPGHLGGRETDTVERLARAGVRYFESNNEPDVSIEWKNGVTPPNSLDIVVDNFILDADASSTGRSTGSAGDGWTASQPPSNGSSPGVGPTCSTAARGSLFTIIR